MLSPIQNHLDWASNTNVPQSWDENKWFEIDLMNALQHSLDGDQLDCD